MLLFKEIFKSEKRGVTDDIMSREVDIMYVNIRNLRTKRAKGAPITIPKRSITRACSPNVSFFKNILCPDDVQ